MKTNSSSASPASAPQQRQALNDAEKKASQTEPGSYKEEATAEKIVEIPPAGPGRKPIRGLDPK